MSNGSENNLPELDREIARLRRALASCDSPDRRDVAIVEALSSAEVQNVLRPILNDGAILKGMRFVTEVEDFGVVELLIETEYPPGRGSISLPARVAVLMEVSPPTVLKALEVHGALPVDHAMLLGDQETVLPVILRAPGIPVEVTRNDGPQEEAAVLRWAKRTGISLRAVRKCDKGKDQCEPPTWPGDDEEGGGGGGGSGGWGTKISTSYCSTPLCFERNPDLKFD